jgi:hypothetical protein
MHSIVEFVRYVFCYTKVLKTANGITENEFNKAWRKAPAAAGCPGRLRTTGEPPYEISRALLCRNG